jgi:hypothetical protein
VPVKTRRRIATTSVIAAFATVSPAAAQTPTQDAYGGQVGGQVQESQRPSGAAPVQAGAAQSGESLPFTGLGLTLLGVTGVALGAAGLATRRASRHGERR